MEDFKQAPMRVESHHNDLHIVGDFRMTPYVKNVESTVRLSYPAGYEWMREDIPLNIKLQMINNNANNAIMYKFLEYQMNQTNRWYWLIPLMSTLPITIFMLTRFFH